MNKNSDQEDDFDKWRKEHDQPSMGLVLFALVMMPLMLLWAMRWYVGVIGGVAMLFPLFDWIRSLV